MHKRFLHSEENLRPQLTPAEEEDYYLLLLFPLEMRLVGPPTSPSFNSWNENPVNYSYLY